MGGVRGHLFPAMDTLRFRAARKKRTLGSGIDVANPHGMRPLRHYLPERAYLITARCFEEKFFFSPDTEEVSVIIATCLAQAVEKYHLELFAYVVMSNHLHLIVRAPSGGLPEAMQLFFSQVARRINALRNRRGPVFSDRYHHQSICDERALRSAIRYVLWNPTRANLTTAPGSWTGLSSYLDTCGDQVLICTRKTRGSQVAWESRRVPRSELHLNAHLQGDGTVHEVFVVACRPATLTDGDESLTIHNRFVRFLLEEERELASTPLTLIPRPLASPHDRPIRPKRTHAPSCIASTSSNRRQYLAERRTFIAAYRLASERFRKGADAVFPPGCCLPWPRLSTLLACSDTFLPDAPGGA